MTEGKPYRGILWYNAGKKLMRSWNTTSVPTVGISWKSIEARDYRLTCSSMGNAIRMKVLIIASLVTGLYVGL